jgi:LysM repeat protein
MANCLRRAVLVAVKKETELMNIQRLIRILAVLLSVGVLAIALSACNRPASRGLETASSEGGSFPIPGATDQNMGGIDVSALSTQTAQAIIAPPIVQQGTPGVPLAVTETPVAPPPAGATAPPAGPVSTTTYVVATPGGPPTSYTMQAGEFLYCIARRFDVNPEDLLTLNGLYNPDLVQPGDTLLIPQSSSYVGVRARIPHPDTHTVHGGDTLNSIACEYGDVSPDMIALQNLLSYPVNLSAGDVLIIP